MKIGWDFSYKFQLKPYSLSERNELERYAIKYMLWIEDEVYIPNKLSINLHDIVKSK